MKLNKLLVNRILFILPLILLCVALVLVATIGFNKSIDYKTYYQFDVHFGTTLQKSELKAYKAEFNKLATKNNLETYSYKDIDENINNGIQVKVLAVDTISDSAMETRLTNFENDIKDIDINSSAYITISNQIKVLPRSYRNYFWMGTIAVLTTIAVVFAYIWFRYEIKLALAYLVGSLMMHSMILSFIAITRLPLSTMFILPYLFGQFVLSAIVVFVFARVKNIINTDNKLTNAEIIKQSIGDASKTTSVIVLIVACTLCILAVVFGNKAFSVSAQLLFALDTCLYAFKYVLVAMWAKIYNREKDIKLANRQKREAEKLEEKNNGKTKEDKLVV